MKCKTEEIRVICAWCKKELGTKEVTIAKGFEGAPSHGICEKCAEDFKAHTREVVDASK